RRRRRRAPRAPRGAPRPPRRARRRPGQLSRHRARPTRRPAVISFVGAGPGAADLITLRGRDRLAGADVVVWASSLVPEALLDHAPRTVEVHDSAGMTLEDVLAVYRAHPDARIVRLHSGDPAIYGAIQQQIETPAAIVVRASWPDEQVVTTTVGRLAAALDALGATRTVLVLVGPALRGAAARSHLYEPQFAHMFRRRSRPESTVGRPA